MQESELVAQSFASPDALQLAVDRSLRDLVGTRARIGSGIGRQQVPAQPRPVRASKFVNPPSAVAPTWFQDRQAETGLLSRYVPVTLVVQDFSGSETDKIYGAARISLHSSQLRLLGEVIAGGLRQISAGFGQTIAAKLAGDHPIGPGRIVGADAGRVAAGADTRQSLGNSVAAAFKAGQAIRHRHARLGGRRGGEPGRPLRARRSAVLGASAADRPAGASAAGGDAAAGARGARPSRSARREASSAQPCGGPR